jgi:hypothetical protein
MFAIYLLKEEYITMHEYVQWALYNSAMFGSLYLVGRLAEKWTWHCIENWDHYQTKLFKKDL